MKSYHIYAYVIALFATTNLVAYAADPSQLQDFCVEVNQPIEGCMSIFI